MSDCGSQIMSPGIHPLVAPASSGTSSCAAAILDTARVRTRAKKRRTTIFISSLQCLRLGCLGTHYELLLNRGPDRWDNLRRKIAIDGGHVVSRQSLHQLVTA